MKRADLPSPVDRLLTPDTLCQPGALKAVFAHHQRCSSVRCCEVSQVCWGNSTDRQRLWSQLCFVQPQCSVEKKKNPALLYMHFKEPVCVCAELGRTWELATLVCIVGDDGARLTL